MPNRPTDTDPDIDSAEGGGDGEGKKFRFSDPVAPEEYERVAKAKAELQATKGEDRSSLSYIRTSTRGRETAAWMRYSALGIQMAVILLVPIFGGLWLDSSLGTKPAGVLIGSGIGIVGSMASVIMTVLRQEKRDEGR